MSDSAYPISLTKSDNRTLVIEWSDGQRRRYGFQELRDACPCASCREKRNHPKPLLPVLAPAETLPVDIQAMHPIGTYAYSIHFNDGHNTGIFSYDLLLRLGVAESSR